MSLHRADEGERGDAEVDEELDTFDRDIAAVTARIDEQVRQAQSHAEQMAQRSQEIDAMTGGGSALRQEVR